MFEKDIIIEHGDAIWNKARQISRIVPDILAKAAKTTGVPFDYLWWVFLRRSKSRTLKHKDILSIARSLYLHGNYPAVKTTGRVEFPGDEKDVERALELAGVELDRKYRKDLHNIIMTEAKLAGLKLSRDPEEDITPLEGTYYFLIRLYGAMQSTNWFPHQSSVRAHLLEVVVSDELR